MLEKIVLKLDPNAEQRLYDLEKMKKRFYRLTKCGVAVDPKSKANFLAIQYNKKKYWFMAPLPIAERDEVTRVL